jgi:hypothetical protein
MQKNLISKQEECIKKEKEIYKVVRGEKQWH